MRTGKHILLAGLLVGLIVGCGASSSTSLSVATIELPTMPTETIAAERTFFIPGESMVFDISLRGVTGGSAVIATGLPGVVNDRDVLIVRSQVESAGVVAAIKEVRDEIVTWIDVETGVVINHQADSRFGEKQAVIASKFGDGAPGSFVIDYQRQGEKQTRIFQMLPEETRAFDIHAVLGLLRAWDADIGQEESLYMLSGRRLWRSTVRVGGYDTIETSMGKHPAIRIDGVAQRVSRTLTDVKKTKPRNFSLWLSDDENRLPLLVLATTEFGDVRCELTEYSRPDQ